MAFDFETTQQKFRQLLSYDWKESADKGWHRVQQGVVRKEDVAFMNEASRYGYDFIQGQSPTLGRTFIIDGSDRKKNTAASAAFTSAFDQVKCGHHTKDKAAAALAVNAFLQKLYADARVSQSWGQWSLGFNPHGFNSYKTPADPRESLALKTIGHILQHEISNASLTSGFNASVDLNLLISGGNVGRLKISGGADVCKVLNTVSGQLQAIIESCARTPLHELDALSKKIGTGVTQRPGRIPPGAASFFK